MDADVWLFFFLHITLQVDVLEQVVESHAALAEDGAGAGA